MEDLASFIHKNLTGLLMVESISGSYIFEIRFPFFELGF